ncbi:MAG: tRNA (adenosine(37)-N6)-threonylcarbamoyltransferase complex dimerization subunit type 1 TsaB [Gammaproteobacteria bacterium]
MRLLAIETATEACSAAVYRDGQVYTRFELAPQRHAELILPMCEAVLAEAGFTLHELDALAFGRGPGAFTGVRIAVGVVQGIALGTGLKVIPISSLAALAQGAVREYSATHVLAAIDARMSEVYTACYVAKSGVATATSAEQVCSAPLISVPNDQTHIGVGTGFNAHAEQIRTRLGARIGDVYPDCYPQAQDVLTLALTAHARGEAVEAEYALPVYLRDRVVDT